MREIKFRGKSKETGEWIYGGIAFGGEEFNNTVYITNPKYDGEQVYWMYEVNPETVGQYTGQKDKENNEVYEDDIVEGLVMVQNDLITVRGLIKLIHGRFVIAEHNCSLYKFSNALGNGSDEITKIGNKHENPEVLNK